MSQNLHSKPWIILGWIRSGFETGLYWVLGGIFLGHWIFWVLKSWEQGFDRSMIQFLESSQEVPKERSLGQKIQLRFVKIWVIGLYWVCKWTFLLGVYRRPRKIRENWPDLERFRFRENFGGLTECQLLVKMVMIWFER